MLKKRQGILWVLCILTPVYFKERVLAKPSHSTSGTENCTASDWALCGCQAVPTNQLPGMTELYHQDLPCQSLCGQRTCQQECTQTVCSYQMGNRQELCTTTVFNEEMIHFVRASSCVFDKSMNSYQCTRGRSVAYPDVQTHAAITEGHCVPACQMDIVRFQCTFEPRFREESIIMEEDMPKGPFKTIEGTGFPGVEVVSGSPIDGTAPGSKTQRSESKSSGDSSSTGKTGVSPPSSATLKGDGKDGGVATGTSESTITKSHSPGTHSPSSTESGIASSTSVQSQKGGSGTEGDRTSKETVGLKPSFPKSGRPPTTAGSAASPTSDGQSSKAKTMPTTGGGISGDGTMPTTAGRFQKVSAKSITDAGVSGDGATPATDDGSSGDGTTPTTGGRSPSAETTPTTGDGASGNPTTPTTVDRSPDGNVPTISPSSETIITGRGDQSPSPVDQGTSQTSGSPPIDDGGMIAVPSSQTPGTSRPSQKPEQSPPLFGSTEFVITAPASPDTREKTPIPAVKSPVEEDPATAKGSKEKGGEIAAIEEEDDDLITVIDGNDITDTIISPQPMDSQPSISSISPIDDDLEESNVAPEPEEYEVEIDFEPAYASERAEDLEDLEDLDEAASSSVALDIFYDTNIDVDAMYNDDDDDVGEDEKPVEPPRESITSPAPAPSEVESSIEEPQPESPTLLPTGDYTLIFSPFGECSQVCAQAGGGFKERTLSCRNAAGVSVPIDFCERDEASSQETFEKCQNDDCGPDTYVVLGDWSDCQSSCAEVAENGAVIPNFSRRDFECRRVSDRQPVEQSECTQLITDLGVLLERECSSIPCVRYRYVSNDWGFCDCETWTQTRTFFCERLSDRQEVNTTQCEAFGLFPPVEERSCQPQDCFRRGGGLRKLQQRDLDFCDYATCSTKGKCRDQECVCKRGFDGPFCQMDNRRRSACPPPSLLDRSGDCCTSGMFDNNGSCCDGINSGTEIDIDGNCCTNGQLDGCGRCGRNTLSFLDASSRCCEVMDAVGGCCESRHVDDCGVCDGFGRSCNTTVALTVNLRDRRKINQCVNRINDAIDSVLGSTNTRLLLYRPTLRRIELSKSNVTFSTGFIAFRINSTFETNGFDESCGIDLVSVKKLPICGNGVCEVGETEMCPKDCPVRIGMCPTSRGLRNQPVLCNGHGLCSIGNAAGCTCFVGYEGQNCQDCADGFFHVGNDSRCLAGEVFARRPERNRSADVQQRRVSVPEQTRPQRRRTGVGNNASTGGGEANRTFLIAFTVVLLTIFAIVVAVLIGKKWRDSEKAKKTAREAKQIQQRVAPINEYVGAALFTIRDETDEDRGERESSTS